MKSICCDQCNQAPFVLAVNKNVERLWGRTCPVIAVYTAARGHTALTGSSSRGVVSAATWTWRQDLRARSQPSQLSLAPDPRTWASLGFNVTTTSGLQGTPIKSVINSPWCAQGSGRRLGNKRSGLKTKMEEITREVEMDRNIITSLRKEWVWAKSRSWRNWKEMRDSSASKKEKAEQMGPTIWIWGQPSIEVNAKFMQ